MRALLSFLPPSVQDGTGTDLVLGVILHKQHIDDAELIHEPVALELLAHARADRRDREGDRVHGLDLGSLDLLLVSGLDWTGIGLHGVFMLIRRRIRSAFCFSLPRELY